MMSTHLCASAEGTGLYDVKKRAPSFLKAIEANESEPASLDQPGCTSQSQDLWWVSVCVCECVCVCVCVCV